MTDLTPPAPPAQTDATTSPRFRVPAEYYDSSPSQVRPLFPRWVPLGCGWASVVLLLVMFVAGGLVAHTGMGRVMAFLIGAMQDEIGSMYAGDVTPAQKQVLQHEMSQLAANLREGKVSVAKLEGVMGTLRESIRDQKITRDEAQKLTAVFHDVNVPPPAAAPKRSR